MSTSLGPLYVKHTVLGATRHDTLLACRLCMSVNAVIPGHVRGARQVRGLWEIQAKTAVARDRLLQNGFIFNEKHIMLHKSDPFLYFFDLKQDSLLHLIQRLSLMGVSVECGTQTKM